MHVLDIRKINICRQAGVADLTPNPKLYPSTLRSIAQRCSTSTNRSTTLTTYLHSGRSTGEAVVSDIAAGISAVGL